MEPISSEERRSCLAAVFVMVMALVALWFYLRPSVPLTEKIVMGTRHCGAVRLEPDILMRLSFYDDLWVVQGCGRTGTGCRPILTYSDSLPPAFSRSDDGKIVIDLFGGRIRKIHADELQTGGKFSDSPLRTHPIEVRHTGGKPGAEGLNQLNQFRARIGFPPGTSDRDICAQFRELNPDPLR